MTLKKRIPILEMKVVQSDYDLRIRGMPYRVIAVPSNMSLHDFAEVILDSFDFDFDHAFGFYDDLKHPYNAARGYELFADMGEESEYPGVKKTSLDQVFTQPKQKWLFLFDYGDEWNFIVSLIRENEADPEVNYPRILTSKLDPLPQYPDLDDESDDEDETGGYEAEIIPDDPELLLKLASIDIGNDEEERAIGRLERILSIDPGNRAAVLNKALCLYFLDDNEESLSFLDGIIERCPEDVALLFAKAAILKSMGDARSKTIWERVSTMEPVEESDRFNRQMMDDALIDFAFSSDIFDLGFPASNRYLLWLKGNLHMEEREYKEALGCFEKVLEIGGDNNEVMLKRAFALFFRGKHADAFEALPMIDHSDHLFTESLSLRAGILTSLNRFDEALEAVDEYIRLVPDDPSPVKSKAALLISMGRGEEAVPILRKLLEEDPGSPELTEMLDEALDYISFEELNLRVFSTVLEMSVEELDDEMAYFVEKVSIRDDDRTLDEIVGYDLVRRYLDELLEREPEKVFTATVLAKIMEEVNGAPGIFPLLRGSVEMGLDNPEEMIKYVGSLWISGRGDETMTEIDRMIEENPGERGPLLAKAGFLVNSNRKEEALELFDEVLAMDPGDPNAIRGKSMLLLLSGGPLDAIFFLDELLEKHPNDLTALCMKVEISRDRMDEGVMMEDVDRILGIDPDVDWVLLLRIEVLLRDGRDDEALADVTRVLAMDERNGEELIEIATRLISRGRMDPALRILQEVKSADPSNEEVIRMIARTKAGEEGKGLD